VLRVGLDRIRWMAGRLVKRAIRLSALLACSAYWIRYPARDRLHLTAGRSSARRASLLARAGSATWRPTLAPPKRPNARQLEADLLATGSRPLIASRRWAWVFGQPRPRPSLSCILRRPILADRLLPAGRPCRTVHTLAPRSSFCPPGREDRMSGLLRLVRVPIGGMVRQRDDALDAIGLQSRPHWTAR